MESANKMNSFIFLMLFLVGLVKCDSEAKLPDDFVSKATQQGHTNNWAVLVDTSRFWFNYRHVANVLSIYRSVKRLGIPDSQIILMVADDMACNPRNPRPATVFNNANENITNIELADAFEQMWVKRRYNEIFFMIDTCQADSMFQKFYSPNILAVASSLVGEDSLSHHVDPAIGVYIIDIYTYYALEFLERVMPESKKTMGEFLTVCPKRVCISTVGTRTDLFRRDPYKVPITDFFGSVRRVEVSDNFVNVSTSTLGSSGTKDPMNKIVKEKFQYMDQLPI